MPHKNSLFVLEMARLLERMDRDWWGEMLDAVPATVASRCRVARFDDDAIVAGTVPVCDLLALNRAIGIGCLRPADPELLDRLIAWYRDAGAARCMIGLSPHARPIALRQELAGRGFQHHNDSVKVYRPSGTPLPAVVTDLRVEEVGPDHAADFAAILAPALEWPDSTRAWLEALLDRDGWWHFMAYEGDRPVATASLRCANDIACLGLAATAPAARRRGAQSALIARRIDLADRLGCTVTVAEIGADGGDGAYTPLHNLRRFGFDIAYSRANWVKDLRA